MRVIVVEPTKATCYGASVLIANASLPITLLESECGDQLDEAIAGLSQGGFGIVADTGTGKSAAIRRIALAVLGEELRIDVLTGDRHDNKNGNVLVMTPGVALDLIKRGMVAADDVIVIDEIHQTSEHLELFMALSIRQHNKVVWMSATVAPEVYAEYFASRQLIVCKAFDIARRAEIHTHIVERNQDLVKGLYSVLSANLRQFIANQRGVLVFVPTRRLAEEAAARLSRPGLYVGYYHGGLPVTKLQEFVAGEGAPKPFVIFMTPIGATGLNLQGVTDVVIVDRCFAIAIEEGYRQLIQRLLSGSELLQMIGRVNGRVVGSHVYIVTSRQLNPYSLKRVAPDFVLGGSLERLALTAALFGINAAELRLIGSMSQAAYVAAFERLVNRGMIVVQKGAISLTDYGRQIERLPVDASWAEVLVAARQSSDQLWFIVALTASVAQLRRLVSHEWVARRFADSNAVKGSDHLTAYNILVDVLKVTARADGDHYDIDPDAFTKLCTNKHYVETGIQTTISLFQTLCTIFGRELPQPESLTKIVANDEQHKAFVRLLATVQSMDFVYQPDRGRLTIGNGGGVVKAYCTIGKIKKWANRWGAIRQSIEGTDIPPYFMEEFATTIITEVQSVNGDQATVRWARQFMGHELSHNDEVVPVTDVPLPLLRSYMLKKAFADWQKPELQMPDVTDPDCTIPDVVTAELGTDPWDDGKWVAYGVVRVKPYGKLYGYVPHWTLSAIDAKQLHAASVRALPDARRDALLYAQHIEAEKARAQARPLIQELLSKKATLVDLLQKPLPRDLAKRVAFATQLPEHDNVQVWFEQMALVTAQLDAKIAVAQQLVENEPDQVAALRPEMLALLAEVRRLLDEDEDDLPIPLYNALVVFDIDDDALPASRLSEVQEWIKAAKAAIDSAKGVMSDDVSAALKARFNRR